MSLNKFVFALIGYNEIDYLISRTSDEDCLINRHNMNRQNVKNQKMCKHNLRVQM